MLAVRRIWRPSLSVNCALAKVRSRRPSLFQSNISIIGRAMAQAVSRRPPITELRVRSRVSPCGICGGQSGIMTGFP
jgi:hypothetical protein